jgi:hypothetical protein
LISDIFGSTVEGSGLGMLAVFGRSVLVCEHENFVYRSERYAGTKENVLEELENDPDDVYEQTGKDIVFVDSVKHVDATVILLYTEN